MANKEPVEMFCKMCGIPLTDENWPKHLKNKKWYICLNCKKEYDGKYYEKNRVKLMDAAKTYSTNNSEKVKAADKKKYLKNRENILKRVKIYSNSPKGKNKRLKRTYGITLDQYDKMFKEQDGCCAICGNPETSVFKGTVRALGVDHNHKTGKVRGLLCTGCNIKLGILEDEDFVNPAMDYLKEYDNGG